jgi:hypothetical protein
MLFYQNKISIRKSYTFMTTIHSAGFILLEQLFYHPNLAHSDNCLFLNGEKKTGKKEREKYYQRNGYASEEVERLRAKRR